jgi:hypothetical protein
VIVHPDRWNTTLVTRKLGVVVHTSESGDTSYESLRRFVEMPGDRLTSNGSRYGSSYHALTRNDDACTFDEMLGDDAAPFSAPPVNATFLHICIPGRAAQSRDEWLDAPSRSGVRAVAKYVVAKAAVHGFPLERLTSADLVAGRGGYCGHVDVTWAWRLSNHTDPGSYFPWDVLAADIAELTAPPTPPEDDMPAPAIAAVYTPGPNVTVGDKWFVLRADGGIRHASGPDVAYAKTVGAVFYEIGGDEHYQQLDVASQGG